MASGLELESGLEWFHVCLVISRSTVLYPTFIYLSNLLINYLAFEQVCHCVTASFADCTSCTSVQLEHYVSKEPSSLVPPAGVTLLFSLSHYLL